MWLPLPVPQHKTNTFTLWSGFLLVTACKNQHHQSTYQWSNLTWQVGRLPTPLNFTRKKIPHSKPEVLCLLSGIVWRNQKFFNLASDHQYFLCIVIISQGTETEPKLVSTLNSRHFLSSREVEIQYLSFINTITKVWGTWGLLFRPFSTSSNYQRCQIGSCKNYTILFWGTAQSITYDNSNNILLSSLSVSVCCHGAAPVCPCQQCDLNSTSVLATSSPWNLASPPTFGLWVCHSKNQLSIIAYQITTICINSASTSSLH